MEADCAAEASASVAATPAEAVASASIAATPAEAELRAHGLTGEAPLSIESSALHERDTPWEKPRGDEVSSSSP